MLAVPRAAIMLLAIVSLGLVLTPPVVADNSDPADEDGCVNLGVAQWGGPVMVYPYLGEAVGFAITENAGDGLTLGVVVVPSLCHPALIGPLTMDELITASHGLESQYGLPALP